MSDLTHRLSQALADRYLLERQLGQGGMATVYLAHDVRHDRPVALKLLRPELAAILGAERFLAEIKTTANLQHPHILSLFDSGEADGLVYYVMPYVEGESLRDRLNRDKQLPVEDAVRLARETADALEYAHQKGIVHRDIKPENILLHGGHALVADFGIALAASRSDGGTRMTETGMSLGTPHYMAPEQAMGEKEITPRADIYALGCVLYEMLTAEPPFQGATAQAIIARVMTEEPRSLTLQRRTVPRHVEAAVQTALQKLPADRFASAADFARALAQPDYVLPTTQAVAAHPAGSPRRWQLWLAAAGAVGLALGGLGGRLTAPRPEPRLTEFLVAPPESVTALGRCCSAGLALSPDGSRLVFVGKTNRGYRLYSRLVGRTEAEPISGTDDAAAPFFSPDGRWLGFQVGNRLRKITLTGGTAITIAEFPGTLRNASWGDNDVIVFAAGESTNRLYRVPASGGTPQIIIAESSVVSHRHPTMLPGGRRVLFTLDPTNAGPEVDRLAVLNLETLSIDTLVTGTRGYYASGHLLFTTADGALLAQPFDPASGKLSGQSVSLLDGVTQRGDGNGEFTVSQAGDVVYLPGGKGTLESLVLLHGRTQTTVPLPRAVNFEDPAFSPDGRRIALRLVEDDSKQDVWILDRTLGTLTRLTVGGGAFPAWSSDGRQIAFATSVGSGNFAVSVQPADGSGPAREALRSQIPIMPLAWLRDGRFLVISPERPGNKRDIGVAAPGDTAIHWIAVTPFHEEQAAVSPDQRWVAYVSDRSGSYEVYVQALSGEGAVHQVSVGGGASPRWSPDGRTLYYAKENQLTAARVSMTPQFTVSARDSVELVGQIDLNQGNTNFDVEPRTGDLLVILQGGRGPSGQPLIWVQHWQRLLQDLSRSQSP